MIMLKDNKNTNVYFLFIIALFFSIIILNRWLVTDLGLLSYGRLWQLYVSYTDLGFVRRGFVGTFLSISGINSIFANEYIFAFFIHHISIIIFTILIIHYCISKNIKNFLFIFGIAFSPTFIIYQGYNTGTLDIFVLIIALINILYVKNYIIFSFNIMVGIFIHETFIFTLPAQFFVFYLCNNSNYIKIQDFIKLLNLKTLLPIVTTATAIVIILFFGKNNFSEMEFKNIMQIKMPNAYLSHSLWSGYFELSASIERHTKSIQILLSNFENGKIFFLLPSVLYLVILILRIFNYASPDLNKPLLFAAIIFPMLISLVAWDYPRWIAISANMSIFITLKLISKSGATYSKWNKILAIFCLLAPFGTVVVDQPFPLHQFVIEKLIR